MFYNIKNKFGKYKNRLYLCNARSEIINSIYNLIKN